VFSAGQIKIIRKKIKNLFFYFNAKNGYGKGVGKNSLQGIDKLACFF